MPTLIRADSATIDDLLSVQDSEIKTIIDESITMTGDLECSAVEKTIVVAGKLTGTIRSAGKVVILGSGVVHGSVRAPLVVLAGTISRRNEEDGVVVDGTLALASSARLICNAVYDTLHTDHGAVLAGMVVPRESAFFKELHEAGRLAIVDTLKRVAVDAHGQAVATQAQDTHQRPHLVNTHENPIGNVTLADQDRFPLGTGTHG